MSVLHDKYEAVKADLIKAEGWLAVHKNWMIACAIVAVVGMALGVVIEHHYCR